MQNIVIKNALQALCFGVVITVIYYFNGRFGTPADMNLLAKTLVTFVGVFFAISMLLDIVFKKHKK